MGSAELSVSLAHSAVIVVITGTMTIASGWLRRRSKPAELADSGGRIRPAKASTVILVIIGLQLSAIGCGVIWFGGVVVGSCFLMAGAALTLFMAPALTRWHDVVWTDLAIEGPSRMFGASLDRARTQIRWDEIARTGKTVTGYSFAETADRRRVYWSYSYPGFAIFEQCFKLHRPDLFGGAAAAGRRRTTVSGRSGSQYGQPARPVLPADTDCQ